MAKHFPLAVTVEGTTRRMMTTREAAKRLGCGPSTIWLLAHRGKFPHVGKLAGILFVDFLEVLAYLEKSAKRKGSGRRITFKPQKRGK